MLDAIYFRKTGVSAEETVKAADLSQRQEDLIKKRIKERFFNGG